MADTKGLMQTRDAYTRAVTEGETSKSHKDWYEESRGSQSEQASEKPYNARWRNRPLTKEEQ